MATFFFAKAFVVFFLAKAFVVLAALAVTFFRFFFAIFPPRCRPLDHVGCQDKRRNGTVPGAAAIGHGVKMADAARRMLIV
ncbi:MAG: hypothetical protein WA425_09845, partial [Xanthobacteraceae bacterium]